MQQKLQREVGHDRFTRLDRTLLTQASEGRVDLRIAPDLDYLVRANRHLLIARLQKLEKMELATPREPGVWELSPQLEPVLKQLGERSTTLALMRGALGEEAADRALATFMIHRDLPRSPVIGRLVGKGLAGDGLGDTAYLVIDGIDGRVHYAEVDIALLPEEIRPGAILTIGKATSVRSVDKTIARLAARNDGFYDPRQHLDIARQTERIWPQGRDGLVTRNEFLIAQGLATIGADLEDSSDEIGQSEPFQMGSRAFVERWFAAAAVAAKSPPESTSHGKIWSRPQPVRLGRALSRGRLAARPSSAWPEAADLGTFV